jgi:hypothetical protein
VPQFPIAVSDQPVEQPLKRRRRPCLLPGFVVLVQRGLQCRQRGEVPPPIARQQIPYSPEVRIAAVGQERHEQADGLPPQGRGAAAELGEPPGDDLLIVLAQGGVLHERDRAQEPQGGLPHAVGGKVALLRRPRVVSAAVELCQRQRQAAHQVVVEGGARGAHG